MRKIRFVTFCLVLVLMLFFVERYIITHREGYGAVDYTNNNIPPGFQFTKDEDIPENLRVNSDYHQISQRGGMFSRKFYCEDLGRDAQIVEYFKHSPGYGIIGGWSYRYAVVCGSDYLIVYGTDYLGEAIYGSFALQKKIGG